jgi:hypothetical protein
MKLGILSDTHDQLERTRTAVAMLREAGAEGLIHCGDWTTPEMISVCAQLPLWFVFGNNDADEVPALEAAATQAGATCLGWSGFIELAGRRIGVAHGHMRYDMRHITSQRPDYGFFGHSHIATDVRENGIRWINPGALHRADEYTVALLDLSTDDLQWFKIPGRTGSG